MGTSTRLESPGREGLEDCYRALPRRGEVEVRCARAALSETLLAMEQVGFIGMSARLLGGRVTHCEIAADKGKQGACYDTGRSAGYTGAALAAFDDDQHILMGAGFGDTKVCEKTAEILASPRYSDYVTVSDADPALASRLESDPVPFDCDTFEADLERIVESLKAAAALAPDYTEPVLYPGPFRALVMPSGELVRRGQPCLVSPAAAFALSSRDRALPGGENAAEAESVVDAYARDGAAALLRMPELGHILSEPEADLTDGDLDRAVGVASPALCKRLETLITSGRDSFVLTGSDPRDPTGCCPSDDVEAANRLVESGVLATWSSEAPEDACPAGVYAFAGEIGEVEGAPVFTRHAELRERVAAALARVVRRRSRAKWVRAVLLVFVGMSLALGLARYLANARTGGGTMAAGGVGDGDGAVPIVRDAHTDAELLKAIAPGVENIDLVCLFRSGPRCPFCLNMESHARLTLKRFFFADEQAGRIAFRSVDAGRPDAVHLREYLDLFTSSIVLVRVRDGAIAETELVRSVWEYTDNLEAFTGELQVAIAIFMESEGD